MASDSFSNRFSRTLRACVLACTLLPAAVTAAIAGDAFPRTVEIEGSAPIRIEARPVRIVPVSARTVEFVAALVAPERIAGFPEQAIEYTTELVAGDGLRDRPRFDQFVAEPVLRFKPDLVVMDPWQSRDTRARLESIGVTVIAVPDAHDWAGTRSVIELLGRALGEEEAAAELIRDGNERAAALAERAASREKVGALAYSNFGAQGFTAGSKTTHHTMMTLAGVTNLAAEDGIDGHRTITFEDLLRIDPDVIVVGQPLNAPVGSSGDRGGASEALLRSEPSLAGLRAVREDRIVSLPAGLFASASHGILIGAEKLADEIDGLIKRLEPAE